MRYILKISLLVLVLGVFTAVPTLSYAWRGHSHTNVDFNFSFWPWGPYYYHDYVYYDPWPSYVVYEQPVTVYQPATVVQSAPAPVTVSGSSDFTVNIPNSRGGYTVVTLKKSGSGFIGPQGEFYPEFPKIDQLRAMYGQ